LRDELIRGIGARIPGARLNGHRVNRLPGNVNFSFEGVASDDLLLRLDLAGICASAGSACTSDSLEPSHVLLAMGLTPALAHGALRLSLGRGNEAGDVERLLALLPDLIARLRE
jgi:cysteine desulfurase